MIETLPSPEQPPAVRPVVVSGSIAMDVIMPTQVDFTGVIHPGSTNDMSVSVFVDDMQRHPGGVAGNICYTLGLLGRDIGSSPYLLGSVGRSDGLAYMARLAEGGVNIEHIHNSERPTATFTVFTDPAGRQFGGFYPGAMFDSDSLSFAPWKDTNPIAVVSPHDPKAMRRQVEECAELGLGMVYDVGQQVTNLPAEDLRRGVEVAHTLILNLDEMTRLAEKIDTTVEYIKKTVPVVIVTKGKEGSEISGASITTALSVGVAVLHAEAVDPTGAGDAYRAGYFFGQARGWEVTACAQLGAVTAAYAVEHTGTQNHRFTLSEVAERYQESFGQPLPQIV